RTGRRAVRGRPRLLLPDRRHGRPGLRGPLLHPRPALLLRLRGGGQPGARHPRRLRLPRTGRLRPRRGGVPPRRRRTPPPPPAAVAAPGRRRGPRPVPVAVRLRPAHRLPRRVRAARRARLGRRRLRAGAAHRGGARPLRRGRPAVLLRPREPADGGVRRAMSLPETLTLLYRGPLASCDYDCAYCPFDKRRDSPERLRADRAEYGSATGSRGG